METRAHFHISWTILPYPRTCCQGCCGVFLLFFRLFEAKMLIFCRYFSKLQNKKLIPDKNLSGRVKYDSARRFVFMGIKFLNIKFEDCKREEGWIILSVSRQTSVTCQTLLILFCTASMTIGFIFFYEIKRDKKTGHYPTEACHGFKYQPEHNQPIRNRRKRSRLRYPDPPCRLFQCLAWLSSWTHRRSDFL